MIQFRMLSWLPSLQEVPNYQYQRPLNRLRPPFVNLSVGQIHNHTNNNTAAASVAITNSHFQFNKKCTQLTTCNALFFSVFLFWVPMWVFVWVFLSIVLLEFELWNDTEEPRKVQFTAAAGFLYMDSIDKFIPLPSTVWMLCSCF